MLARSLGHVCTCIFRPWFVGAKICTPVFESLSERLRKLDLMQVVDGVGQQLSETLSRSDEQALRGVKTKGNVL